MEQTPSNIPRRDFIQRTAAGVGAGLVLGAPTIVRASDTAPSKKLNVALVGMGKQGTVLFDAMRNIPGLHFQAVCDIWDYNLKGGMGNVPLLAIRREIAQAIQLIVSLGTFRMPDGREVRRVKEINFVTGGVEGELITHEPIFQWTYERGKPEWTGKLMYTQAAPLPLLHRLEERVADFNWRRDVDQARYFWPGAARMKPASRASP